MIHIKCPKRHISYKCQKIFVGIVCCFLIAGACFSIGTNTALLNGVHQTVISKTDSYISELSRSIRNALQDRFQRTLMALESVARSCKQDTVLSAGELEELQEQAELLQFEYFAFISPDGSTICSDGISRTFAEQDGIIKAFEGQPLIDVKTPEAELNVQNKKIPIFAVPIYSRMGSGEITGVLAAPISPERTDFFLTQSYYGGNVFFNIIQSDGTEVFMTKRSHISRFDELLESDSINNVFDALDVNVKIISDTGIDDLRKAAAPAMTRQSGFTF